MIIQFPGRPAPTAAPPVDNSNTPEVPEMVVIDEKLCTSRIHAATTGAYLIINQP